MALAEEVVAAAAAAAAAADEVVEIVFSIVAMTDTVELYDFAKNKGFQHF